MCIFSAVECCNTRQRGRVFYLPQGNCRNKVLVFLDRCEVCGQPIALIKQQSERGDIKIIVRRSGERAVELFTKKQNQLANEFKLKAGNKANMSWLWFDGKKDLWVRDFNNTKVFKVG